jgi:acyl-CoA reductase-like NAD-dependent aldehyde dehydrogenase
MCTTCFLSLQPFSDEIFGPVAALFRFTDEEAVLREANDSK